jgi:uncharacterized membrane protein YagU involved in acid resistance
MLRAAARGTTAGLIGTCAMTAGLAVEKHLRRNAPAPIDYDASDEVVTAASSVTDLIAHWTPATDAQRRGLFLVVHWGYGSVVGSIYPLLRSRMSERVATVVFFAACQTMAMTLFPTLGTTPPPWRWRRSVLASSVVQHGIYAATVARADRFLRAEADGQDQRVAAKP